jgi:hypothetical protein
VQCRVQEVLRYLPRHQQLQARLMQLSSNRQSSSNSSQEQPQQTSLQPQEAVLMQLAAAQRKQHPGSLQQSNPIRRSRGRRSSRSKQGLHQQQLVRVRLHLARSPHQRSPSPHQRQSGEPCRRRSGQPKQHKRVALLLVLLAALVAVLVAQARGVQQQALKQLQALLGSLHGLQAHLLQVGSAGASGAYLSPQHAPITILPCT